MRRITSVAQGSIAQRHKLVPGDIVLSINGEPVLDEIDYQALTARRHVTMVIAREDGHEREIDIVKSDTAALGLQFDDSLIGNPKTCANNCLFCFVEQMPRGMRPSLYLKDDDWRLSLLMGNYITLTNISKREFDRAIRRKASPLYISVHTTNPVLRARMLGNRNGDKLMERLHQLKAAGLSFHSQLVLCPGINDGMELVNSLRDLEALYPSVLSVALVPVGLTRFRDDLQPIKSYSKEEAEEVLAVCSDFQHQSLESIGTRLAYPADEFLCIANAPIPPSSYYEGYPQLENGVGMLRKFEDELKKSFEEHGEINESQFRKTVLLPCGTAAAPYLKEWVAKYIPDGVTALVVPIRNLFFGESVTVSGLLCAEDLISQLAGIKADEILIVDNMLNSDNTLFLDDLTPKDLENALHIPVRVFHNSGHDFYHTLASPPFKLSKTENRILE